MKNKVSDEAFPSLIRNCRGVASLNLSYNLLTEKSLQWLESELPNLGRLSNITLSNNKIQLRVVRERLEQLRRRGLTVSL